MTSKVLYLLIVSKFWPLKSHLLKISQVCADCHSKPALLAGVSEECWELHSALQEWLLRLALGPRKGNSARKLWGGESETTCPTQTRCSKCCHSMPKSLLKLWSVGFFVLRAEGGRPLVVLPLYRTSMQSTGSANFVSSCVCGQTTPDVIQLSQDNIIFHRVIQARSLGLYSWCDIRQGWKRHQERLWW